MRWALFKVVGMSLSTSQVAIAAVDCSASGSQRQYTCRRILQNEKVVHFVRHAEGYHNAAARNDPLKGYLQNDLEDAELTEEGLRQCKVLSEDQGHIFANSQLVIISPMTRTLQTASYSFSSLKEKVPWIALESIRERTGLHPCDKRRAISHYKPLFPHVMFDHVEHDQDPLFPKYTLREPDDRIIARCEEFLQWLAEREEREVVVVTHSNFLRTLFSKVLKVEADLDAHHGHFRNCEIKTYVINLPTRTANPPRC